MTEPKDSEVPAATEILGYPDFEPDTLGQLKSLKRLPGMESNIATLQWGEKFQEWPDDRKISYLSKLSSSMNHAADVAQQQLFSAWDLLRSKEKQITQLKQKVADQNEVLQNHLTRTNGNEQELQERIVELHTELRAAKKRIKELEGGNQR
jgi:hypothetical protein